ncbi:MAG: lysylphosphatidylglycerol synthase transmembrane domain-containing protein [Planctomycetota bacterium]|nr:lysylphosphatidylglycerol synthase transmembrane domain-containing protein [Planctomycetota bacterium]
MKGAAVTVLKLMLVTGLMAFVFSKIEFADRLVRLNQAGEIVSEQEGDIEGPWNGQVVRFVTESGEAQEVVKGPQADGTELQIEPGFLTYWRNMDLSLFALGAFCYFLTVLIAGSRWWWLLRVNGTDVSLFETLRFTWIGVFFNTVVPGATGGDLVKALYIMKRCPGHRPQVLVSVIVDRLLGLASLAILGAIVVLFALDDFGEIALAIWGVIFAVGLMGLVAFSKRLRQLVRLKALLEKLPQRIGHVLKMVDRAVFFYRDHKGVIVASLLAGVLNHVVSVLSVILIADAMGVGMPWFECFVLVPVINIVSALPIAPQGWGVGEYLYYELFSRYGAAHLGNVANAGLVMGTRGAALSVLYRLQLTFWSLLGGLFVLFEKDRVTKADIEHEVELEQQEEAQGEASGSSGDAGSAEAAESGSPPQHQDR